MSAAEADMSPNHGKPGTVPAAPIRILHLEDSTIDADLISERLTMGGIPHSVERVMTRPDFATALERGGFDLILSDFSLPAFDGMSALAMAQTAARDTPFVFVSGVLGEDVAVESLKRGATDFVVKQRLERLPATVLRALDDARRRAEHRQVLAALQASEARLQRAVAEAPFPIMIHAEDGQIVQLSRAWTEITGFTSDELPNMEAWSRLAYEGRPEELRGGYTKLYDLDSRSDHGEFEICTRNTGKRIWSIASSPIGTDAAGRRLVVSMAADLTERKAAEMAYRDSEERLRLALEAAQAGTWDWDVAVDCFDWSEEYGRLCGLPPVAESVGLDAWLSSVHPDDREPLRHGIDQALDGHRSDFRLEYRVVHPEKGTRWLLGLGRATYGEDGAPRRITGLSIDITERKEAEERQLLLAREVDHRARNLLAVVQAMLSLTKANTVEDFVSAVKGRVAALSRAHALLSSSRWAGVELAKLVTEEMNAFGGVGRVHVEGPPVTLHPEATQAATVVLHELATNAAKYGALSVPEGRLDLIWHFEGKDVVLCWREHGGPTPTPPTRKGFGSQIMFASARQLGGELKQDWRPEGLLAELRIAAINVMSSAAPSGSKDHTAVNGVAVPPGSRILLVEDNGFVALEVERLLRQLGCEIVGPAPTLARALELAQAAERPDAAILDVHLGAGADSFPVAQVLRDRGVPYLFCTGYDRPVIGGIAESDAEVIAKPIQFDQLAGALGRILAPADVEDAESTPA